MGSKRIFYKPKLKIPGWLQYYVLWGILGSILAIFTGYFYAHVPGETVKNLNSAPVKINLPRLERALIKGKAAQIKTLSKATKIEKSYSSGEHKCSFEKYRFGSEKPRKALLFPSSLKKHKEGMTLYYSILHYYNSSGNSLPVDIILYEDLLPCIDLPNLGKTLEIDPGTYALALFPKYANTDENNNGKLLITGDEKQISSLAWYYLFRSTVKPENLYEQLLKSAFYVKINIAQKLIKEEYPATGWEFPLHNDVTLQRTYTTLEVMTNSSALTPEDMKNHSFQFIQKFSFDYTAIILWAILFYILTWFPLLNAFHQSREKLTLVPQIAATIYYMIIPFSIYIILTATSEFLPNSYFVLPLIFLAGFGIYIAIRKLEKNLLNFRIQQLSAIFLWQVIFLAIVAAKPAFFFMAIPLVLLVSKIRLKGIIAFILIIIPGTLPFLFGFFTWGLENTSLLYPKHVALYLFHDHLSLILTFISAGSLTVALADR